MIFWNLTVLCLVRACMAVTIMIDGQEVDCNKNCVCCKGGVSKCGIDDICKDGCVETIYGWRCHHSCPENCYTCENTSGKTCYNCKDTFYAKHSLCSKRCSVGCNIGTCNDDGTCSPCKADFEGPRCELCMPGKYGSDCSLNCANQNCRCTTDIDCISCKKGFYGSSTSCQTPCSTGCQNGICNDDGTCDCTPGFIGTTCSECVSGYNGTHCDELCSVGCLNIQCSKDSTCFCRDNFEGTTCNTCSDGRYGEYCDQVCSVGCGKTMACERNNGSCKCLPNFTGDKCEQCIGSLYGQSCDLHCPDTCKGGTCSRNDWTCTHGCVDGYSGDNCTNPCDHICATCLQYSTSYCVSCLNGYTETTCRCPPNCICAVGLDICISCTNGYENSEQQCTCQSKYCLENECDQCINQTFYVDNIACCSCPDHCKDGVCSNGPECISGCMDGFYGLNCSQSCLSLSADCLRCTQTYGKCLECKDGFYPNDYGSCINCSISCMGGLCNSAKVNGCINDLEDKDCSERRIYIGSSTISALSALSVLLGISLICTAAGCYLWNRRMYKPTEPEDQLETEMTYEQLQRQANEPTYTNVTKIIPCFQRRS